MTKMMSRSPYWGDDITFVNRFAIFANMMVRDHMSALSDARATFDRSHLVPNNRRQR